MERSTELERRLRIRRYKQASKRVAKILEGIGITEYVLLPLDDVAVIWSRYIARLRSNSEAGEHWPLGDREAVHNRLDKRANVLDGVSVVWLALVDGEPVGVELSAEVPLRAASSYFVTRASDLMLTTRDAVDGVCVEWNRLDSGEEYEIVAWGAFAKGDPA